MKPSMNARGDALACAGNPFATWLDEVGQGSHGNVYERAFEKFGLPLAIRTENGIPLASPSAFFGLSKLSVWWLRPDTRV